MLMSVRFTCVLAAAAMVATAGTAMSQDANDVSVDPAVKLRALETMNDAASGKLADALKHEQALRKYASENGLDGDCGGNAEDSESHDMAMSFDEALQVAIQHEQVAPSGHNTQATPDEVNAYTTLAKSTWEKLQSTMANVEHLSDCLHSQNKFNDYLDWNGKQARAEHQAMLQRNAEASKEAMAKQKSNEELEAEQYKAWKAAQAKQHQQFLNQAWTKYKFDRKTDLKAYKYRTKYGPNSYYNTYAGQMYGGGGYYGGYGGYGGYGY